MKTARFKVSFSKDGSISQSKECLPVCTLEAARAEAGALVRCNRSVTILYEDLGEYCADNRGKWFLHSIVK